MRGGGFACSNGKCIQTREKCNGKRECSDGSDETTEVCGANCENMEGGGFACSNGQCISAKFKCDGGTPDCDDKSDEAPEMCGLSISIIY